MNTDYISHLSSDCCDASLTITGMCLECGEPAEPISDDDEEAYPHTFPTARNAIMEMIDNYKTNKKVSFAYFLFLCYISIPQDAATNLPPSTTPNGITQTKQTN